MSKKECIAMLLAGGQGSRLGALTSKIAKPAVSFGGKFRIIDFSLSNCANSGIDTVGVLTQYRPYLLNSYVGSGEAWDLDERGAGVSILPPYATQEGGSWYAGTADAVAQNIGYIKEHDPEYVLILSGDHLYRMDYRKMLKAHIEHNADLTISVMPVPWEEASRFGKIRFCNASWMRVNRAFLCLLLAASTRCLPVRLHQRFVRFVWLPVQTFRRNPVVALMHFHRFR